MRNPAGFGAVSFVPMTRDIGIASLFFMSNWGAQQEAP